MNQISASWSPLVTGPEEELASFLEFADLPLTFPFDEAPQHGPSLQQEADGAMDTPMGNGSGILPLADGQLQHQLNHPNPVGSMAGYQPQFHPMSIPGDLFNQHQQHPHLQLQVPPYRPQGMIPPTPTSIEMHGDRQRYYQTAGDPNPHGIYDRLGTNIKDQVTFTPLVSPAVTPLDTQFQYPEFAVPGEYFSPLTSPALEAQNNASRPSTYGAQQRSDTSDTTSPIDMNIDFSAPLSAPGSSSVRKSKRRNLSTSKTPNRTVRQSPSMKPQGRKKQVSSSAIPSKEVPSIIQNAQQKPQRPTSTSLSPAAATLGLPYSQESSEAGSISPEPCSENLMPPPATPRSTSSSKSPYLPAQQQPELFSMSTTAANGEAATPASLMNICKTNGQGCTLQQQQQHQHTCSIAQPGQARGVGEVMEDIALPEPAKAATKPILTPLDTSNAHHRRTAVASSSQKAHLHGSLTSPAAANSLFSSPQVLSAASPISASSHKRADSRGGGRETKKRNTSVQVSPAIRPKVSPNIKPLLPEGAIVSAETSALLLASKSNYQNILEGTHLPGLNYPETLSTNLTSKRTSHKIAEQGRRNRINMALQEIASLLPPPKPPNQGMNVVAGKDGGSNDGSPGTTSIIVTGTATQQSSSKASTVELAIEYIKSLQAELRDVKGKLDVAEKELGKKEKTADKNAADTNAADPA